MYSQDALGVGIHERRKRRRFYFVLLSVISVIFLVILGASWLVLQSPLFHLKKIAVEGNKAVSSGAVMDLLQSRIVRGGFTNALLGFNNILTWPKELARADLSFIPEIKSLKIDKNYGAAIVSVKIEERELYGTWCFRARTDAEQTQTNAEGTQNDAENIPRMSAFVPQASALCWWFDKDGILFKRALAAEGSLVTTVDDYSQKNLGLGSEILPQDFIPNAFSVFEVLKLSGLGIEEVRLNNLALQELEVSTYPPTSLGVGDGLPAKASAKAGPKLYFSLRFPADNDLAVIKELTAKPGFNKLEYVDFRTENRAYYK